MSADEAPDARPLRVLVLQGGGALGAYQAGVFEALAEGGVEVDWVAGVSIGAVNAAMIAGSPPGERVARLRAFWEEVTAGPATSPFSGAAAEAVGAPFAGLANLFVANPFLVNPWTAGPWSAMAPPEPFRQAFNAASAAASFAGGAPGFFTPRAPPAWLWPAGSPEALGLYDAAPLARTLERLVDWERLNGGAVRVSVGAVEVASGALRTFDTSDLRVGVEHVMASAALPPAFAPVRIGEASYWDGGVVSNTPVQHVLDRETRRDLTIFQVDLFPISGALPATLADVTRREKEIRYASRTKLSTEDALRIHTAKTALRALLEKLPEALRQDPDVATLRETAKENAVNIVRLIYRRQPYEGAAMDFEFSRATMEEHWKSGIEDVRRTLEQRDEVLSPRPDGAVKTFDLGARRGR